MISLWWISTRGILWGLYYDYTSISEHVHSVLNTSLRYNRTVKVDMLWGMKLSVSVGGHRGTILHFTFFLTLLLSFPPATRTDHYF